MLKSPNHKPQVVLSCFFKTFNGLNRLRSSSCFEEIISGVQELHGAGLKKLGVEFPRQHEQQQKPF